MTKLVIVAAAVGGAIAWGEYVNWRASRALLGVGERGSEVVVVLGVKNGSSSRANALNRWRVRAAMRSVDAMDGDTRMVFSGGDAANVGVSEAALMARYAVRECGYRGRLDLEEESRSTWENVQNVIPLLEDAGRIKLVSNSLHAKKARLYLWRLRPDLAQRLVRAVDYCLGEWTPLKPLLAAYELRALRRANANLRRADAAGEGRETAASSRC